MRGLMLAAALAVTGAAAEAVVYTYDGAFIVDTGPGTPNEIDLILTLPDSLFAVPAMPGREAYNFTYIRGASGERFVFNSQDVDGAGIILPDSIANSDPTYALLGLSFDTQGDVVYNIACFDFPPINYCQSLEEGGQPNADAIYLDGEVYTVPQTAWMRTGDPFGPTPVPLPAGGVLLLAAAIGLRSVRHRPASR